MIHLLIKSFTFTIKMSDNTALIRVLVILRVIIDFNIAYRGGLGKFFDNTEKEIPKVSKYFVNDFKALTFFRATANKKLRDRLTLELGIRVEGDPPRKGSTVDTQRVIYKNRQIDDKWLEDNCLSAVISNS